MTTPSDKLAGYDSIKVTNAGDALNRGIAMVNTVWLALQHCETDEDYSAAIDSLYEAQRKLVEAEDLIGLYRRADAAEPEKERLRRLLAEARDDG